MDSEKPVYPSGHGLGQQLLSVGSALGQFPVSNTECENSHLEELTKPAPRLGPVITVFEWSFIGTQSHPFILVLPMRVFSRHDG